MLRIGRTQLVLPPGAFLQATAAGEAILARLVAAHCAGARTVADLFCGVGPFALRLAERARIIAADNDPAAIAALQRAATGTQGLKPIEALARDLFRRPFVPVELKRFDAVVFDPPRQGAEAQARELAASAGADRGRGLVQSGDLRARCAHPDRRRLSSRARDPGRSVPVFRARGIGGAFSEVGRGTTQAGPMNARGPFSMFDCVV